MRCAGIWLAGWVGLFVALAAAGAAEPESRYNIAADRKGYPQATPKEALASVVKAARAKAFGYLLAHLADPSWVDDRVKRVYGGRFDQLVADCQGRLDPVTVKQLEGFLEKGVWSLSKGQARVTLEDVKDRVVFLKQINGLWYLEHRQQP